MTKFLKRTCLVLALLLCCTFVFVGCGENEEETPHHLEVKAACYVNGVKDDTWVLTNHNALKGSGDYAEQDRVDLEAPIEHYYQFIGWYDDSGEYIEPACTHSFWWNMAYDRDGYVEARYVPLEYDIVFINATTGPSPVMAHYNCVTKELQYAGQQAQVVDSLPKPTHADHYKNEKWLYFNNLEKECENFPINEEDEGLMPLVSGQPELELTLQADYEKEDCYVSIVFKDTNGEVVEALTIEECLITYEVHNKTGDEIPIAESYKYDEAVIDLWVDFAEIDTKGYNFIGIFAGNTEIGDFSRLHYTIVESVEIVIKVEAQPAQD